MLRRVGRLHVLTDATLQDRCGHEELARLAVEGGADTIQFREKRASTREQIRLARALSEACRRAGVPLIVNDRVDVALAADAAGVHLGREDFPIAMARRLLGPDRIIGGSASTLAQAEEVMWAGADYVGLGAIYATTSKAGASAPLGPGTLREVARGIEIPVIAIGGIGLAQIPEVIAAGAYGVAVIQAVALAEDPRAAAAAIRAAIQAAIQETVHAAGDVTAGGPGAGGTATGARGVGEIRRHG
jgi:thiamine-phosphate pyrophosphorylase